MNQLAIFSAAWGNIAASKNPASATAKTMAPMMDSSRMLPMNPEALSSPVNCGRLKKTKPSITTPSKMRSTMMVASDAETETPSRCLRMTARSTSPARAG